MVSKFVEVLIEQPVAPDIRLTSPLLNDKLNLPVPANYIQKVQVIQLKHYIIVKFNNRVHDKNILCEEIRNLFADAEKIEGVHNVSFYPSVIDLPNRYDLMILLEMDREALPLFDASQIHRDWKAGFSEFLEAKTIFDCD